MLLPNNNLLSSNNFDDHFCDSVVEKRKLFLAKCMALSPLSDCTVRNNSNNGRDGSTKGKFRFCVCTGGPKKNNKKSSTKWYIKVNFVHDK